MLGIGNGLIYNAYLEDFSLAFHGLGTEDIMVIDDIQAILRGSWTINYWVRLNDSTPAPSALNGYYNDSNNQLTFGIDQTGPNGSLIFKADGTAVSINVSLDLDGSSGTLSGNSQSDWFMMTLTCTLDSSGSSASTFAMYSNANAISTNRTLAKAKHVAADTGGLGFGFGAPNAAVHRLNGNMDEIAIWNTALDADAVTALYHSGLPLPALVDSGNYDNSSNLVRYYTFNQGVGTSVTDQTGNTNGTLSGSPVYSTDTPATA